MGRRLPFGLNLNTGEFAGFFNLPSLGFVYMSTMNGQALRPVCRQVPKLPHGRGGRVQRSPETFARLLLLSTCRSFNSLDGKRRYKFRAVPAGKGPHTEVEPEPFKPDEGPEDRHKPMMSHHRLDDERRPTDYLRTVQEQGERGGGEVPAADPAVSGRRGTRTRSSTPTRRGHPFLDLEVITLHAPMNDWEVEQTPSTSPTAPGASPWSSP